MLLQEAGVKLAGWQVDIVATDISSEVIDKAKLGLYSQFEVQRGLPVQWLLKYFTQIGEQWQIAASLRSMVEFRQFNLLHGYEGLGTFDVIFCRNVLIYFDAPTKSEILARFGNSLVPGGALLLGAAETVIGLTDRLAPDTKHRGLYGHAPVPTPALRAAAG
jgi:chemotaxis protein methyltransferase CheR